MKSSCKALGAHPCKPDFSLQLMALAQTLRQCCEQSLKPGNPAQCCSLKSPEGNLAKRQAMGDAMAC